MITFIDEKGTEHSALVAYSVTNAVNGELSVKGTIYTNDKVLHGIDRGWRFRLDDEYYRVTYAKPNDTGRQIEVEFDAVHQFFYDMSKSVLYETLDGSKPLKNYLDTIFSNSGYTYSLEESAGSIRKENFGNKSRLSLFNDIIKATGLEFFVRGHVVRILKRIGTDLSTIVRKDFNMNELKIEKDINSFVTYQRGLGAWKDDEDHSKGRYESEYESPLAKIYGRIEAEPVVDERYKDTGKLLERLKENVDKSYKVSVEIDMEDLSQAGYRLSRPNPGDYIMAINENLGFRQKVRIVSFTSEYDVGGNLISRKVVCNDIGSVQRRASEMSSLARSVHDVAAENAKAIATATKALVSADGKNTNYFGDVKPLDVPKGTLRKGDRLFLTVGDKKQLYFWNGAEWELEPTEFDHEKFDMEFNRKSQEIKKTIQENRQMAEEAKRIGLDSIAGLEEFKSQATSAQTALSGDLDALKLTVTSEVNQASEYRRTTTEALSRMTGQMNGFAIKSEVKQDIDGLTQTFAKMKVGGRNYYRNSQKLVTKPRFIQFDVYPYLSADNIGQEWTFSFDLKINETGVVRQLHFFNHPRNGLAIGVDTSFNPSKEWQRYSFTAKVVQGGAKPTYSKGAMAIYDPAGDNDISVRNIKFEKGTLATDWIPAIEDGEDELLAIKTEFKKTADGLSAKMSAIESYVGQDGQRQEVLRKYTREESARQATAVRELVTSNYVGKATYQETVRAIESKFEAITNPQNGSIATQIANYKNSVDGRFAEIASLIAGANQTDFQRIKETSQLYERLIGSTEKEVTDKVARMALTNELFQVEVSKNQGLRTVQSQLAGSWAIKNLNSAGDLISGLNLGANGVNRLDGRLTHITGQTLIDNAVIKSAMIESVLADKITAGTLNAANVNIINLNANKIVGLDATFLRGKIENAIIDWLKGKTIVSQNGSTTLNLQTGVFTLNNEDSSITFSRNSDNTKTEFNKDGINFLKNQKVIATIGQSFFTSIYENDTQRGFCFELPDDRGMAFFNNNSSSFFEINPKKRTLAIQAGFSLLIGSRVSQSVSLEHVFGTVSNVNFSGFRAKGTRRQQLRFYADGRIEITRGY